MIMNGGQMGNLNKLILSGKTIFTVDDAQKIFSISDKNYVRLVLHRLKKSGILQNIMSGIFALPGYDIYELASKIIPGSYISLETVLQKEGIIFQDYSHTIMLVSHNTVSKKISDTTFQYHKISDKILFNPAGIINYNDKYMIACAERAVCDSIYLYKNIHFDNLRSLSISLLEDIKNIYPPATILRINQLITNVGSIKA